MAKTPMTVKYAREMYRHIKMSPSGMWLMSAAEKVGPSAANMVNAQSLLKTLCGMGVALRVAEKDVDNKDKRTLDSMVMASIPSVHGDASLPAGWHWNNTDGVGKQCKHCKATKHPDSFSSAETSVCIDCESVINESKATLSAEMAKKKVCSECGIEKPITSFYANSGKCKTCLSAIRKAKIAEEKQQKENERSEKVKAELNKIKMSKVEAMRKQAEELLAAAEAEEKAQYGINSIMELSEIQLHVARSFTKCQRLFDEIVDAMDDMEKAANSFRDKMTQIKQAAKGE